MTHHPGTEPTGDSRLPATRKLPCSTGIWDEEEIQGVTDVLRGPPESITIGPRRRPVPIPKLTGNAPGRDVVREVPHAGFERAHMQPHLEARGIATRTVWTGNAARQPMLEGATYRIPKSGLPNADRVVERGMLVSMGHGFDADDIGYIIDHIEGFVAERRG